MLLASPTTNSRDLYGGLESVKIGKLRRGEDSGLYHTVNFVMVSIPSTSKQAVVRSCLEKRDYKAACNLTAC